MLFLKLHLENLALNLVVPTVWLIESTKTNLEDWKFSLLQDYGLYDTRLISHWIVKILNFYEIVRNSIFQRFPTIWTMTLLIMNRTLCQHAIRIFLWHLCPALGCCNTVENIINFNAKLFKLKAFWIFWQTMGLHQLNVVLIFFYLSSIESGGS